ncbi:hypothetical protein F2Q68_00012822 [Brassica cretica]|uniref:Inhibitor I9 domain-containing protein n=1 Tax=Brassica cretica TaxID=69181 RepID=A0A8S9HRN2_BRACR|nr:hypothetical protein F2Q68_00012822 [Brassica cretica]
MEPKTLFVFTIFLLFVSSSSETLKKQTYVIQLHPNSQSAKAFPSKLDWHLSFLQEAVLGIEEENEDPSTRILYSYASAIEGFSAQLTESEAKTLKNLPEVVAVRPDHVLQVFDFKPIADGLFY